MNLEELKSKIQEDHINCLVDNKASLDKILAKYKAFSKLIEITDNAPIDLSPRLIEKTLIILEKLNKI